MLPLKATFCKWHHWTWYSFSISRGCISSTYKNKLRYIYIYVYIYIYIYISLFPTLETERKCVQFVHILMCSKSFLQFVHTLQTLTFLCTCSIMINHDRWSLLPFINADLYWCLLTMGGIGGDHLILIHNNYDCSYLIVMHGRGWPNLKSLFWSSECVKHTLAGGPTILGSALCVSEVTEPPQG